MRLDIALVHRCRLEGALDDDIGLLEARVHVAELVLHLAGDVGRLAVELEVVMQDRRAVLDRVLDVDGERQHLVFDFDQLQASRAMDCDVAATAATG